MQLYLSVSETGTDVAANTSTISWSLTAYNDSANHIYNNYTSGSSAPTWGVNVGGITGGGNFTYDVAAWGTIYIAGGSGTIAHNADGTKSISYSGEANGKNSSYFGAIYTSGSMNLSTIPRTSSISLGSTSVAVGSNQTITVTKATSTYTDVLTYSCEGATGTISSNASGTVTWKIPDAVENKMTTKTSATCTITCTTKNGSTTIGTTSKTFTVTIPSSYTPTISWGATTLVNAYNNKMVGGYSSATQAYTLGMTPSANSATISSVAVTLNKGTIASKSNTSATTNTLPSESSDYSLTMTVKVTDTRGRTKSATKTIGTVYAFVSPTINVQNLYRSDDQGAPLPEGTYAYTNVTISSDYTITTATATVNNVTYTLTEASGSYMAILGGGNLSTAQQYTVTYTVQDQFMVDMGIPAIQVKQILTSMQLPISLYDNGSEYGVTLGRMATGDGFNCYMDSFIQDKRYDSYSSVDQLGLTVGSATIVDLWNAMPNESFIFTPASEFTSTEVPSQNGSIFIMKKWNWRGRVEFYGTTENMGDYRMFLVGTNGRPDGHWRKLPKPIGTGTAYRFSNIAIFTGYLTSSGTQIYFGIPLPTLVPSGVTISLTGTATIRHADGGYILNNADISTLGNLSFLAAENFVRVTITMSSASSFTKNSPVVIQSVSLVLAFS